MQVISVSGVAKGNATFSLLLYLELGRDFTVTQRMVPIGPGM